VHYNLIHNFWRIYIEPHKQEGSALTHMARNLTINALIACTALLIALCICEGLTRLLLPAPQIVSVAIDPNAETRQQKERKHRLHFLLPGLPTTTHFYVETEVGLRLRANAVVVIENHPLNGRRTILRTNSVGYRNPEIPPKDPQITRILFLGDSITFGDYLLEEETFVRRVEAKAQKQGKRWETINASIGGISLKTELSILKETGLALQPDVVVLGFYLNDFLESPIAYLGPDLFFLKHSHFLIHLSRWISGQRLRQIDLPEIQTWRNRFIETKKREIGEFIDLKNEAHVFTINVARRFKDWGGTWSPAAWETMQPMFDELIRLSEQHSFKLLVVCFPVIFQVTPEAVFDFPQQQLKRVFGKFQVPVLDLLPALRNAHRRTDQPLFYDQCHHTPAGNELIADILYTFLETHID